MLIFVLCVVLTFASRAQDYMLDFSDPSTYTITCGKINPGQWSVKNDTCYLYTPYIRAEVAETDVDFIFNVNQSGNGDEYDRGYVYYSIDGGSWELDTFWAASEHPSVYTLNTTVTLEYGHYVQFIVKLATNDNTEFWAILDGGIQGTDGNDSEHNIEAYYSEPVGLPVSLLNFTGFSENNTVILEWATASETNNDYFIVEKSEDGILFSDFSYVDGAGNSNNLIEYSCKDENPFQTSFYRLKQIDFNGAYSISQIIKVSAKDISSCEIGISSNNGNLNIMTDNAEGGQLQLNIFSVNGAMVYSNSMNIENGSSTITISPEIPANNIYIICVSINGHLSVNSKVYFN